MQSKYTQLLAWGFVLLLLILSHYDAAFVWTHQSTSAKTRPRAMFDQALVAQYIADFGWYERQQRVGRLKGLGKSRLHSLPLITGDGFRALADDFIDDVAEMSNVRCQQLGTGQALNPVQAFILYVDVHVQVHFFQECFPHMTVPVILITHNGDPAIPAPQLEAVLENPKLVHWFGQNTRIFHPKLSPIPIGLENRYNGPPNAQGYHGSMPEVIMGIMASSVHAMPAFQALETTRTHTWAHFDVSTNPSERGMLFQMIAQLQSDDRLDWIKLGGTRLGPLELYREMLQYAAIVCPHGNGLDTHRAWEALYLGRVPIVINDTLSQQWEQLPVLQLQDWRELLDQQTVIAALSILSRLSSEISTDKLFLPWWMCKIGSAANRQLEFCGREALLRVLRLPGPRV